MLSLNELSNSSFRLFIAVLDVCNNDTIVAEYDVVRNKDSMRINRKTIRDDKVSGERDVPRILKRIITCLNYHTANYSKNPHSYQTDFSSHSSYIYSRHQVLKMNTCLRSHVSIFSHTPVYFVSKITDILTLFKQE